MILPDGDFLPEMCANAMPSNANESFAAMDTVSSGSNRKGAYVSRLSDSRERMSSAPSRRDFTEGVAISTISSNIATSDATNTASAIGLSPRGQRAQPGIQTGFEFTRCSISRMSERMPCGPPLNRCPTFVVYVAVLQIRAQLVVVENSPQ